MSNKSKNYPIKARSHLLHLLGDELIGDDRLAVFELVKNGYDADANKVTVSLELNEEHGRERIIVEDNGHGMDLDDITGKWLEIGTDSKRLNRDRRSKRYNRLPLGEKGVGRLAAFKLGDVITLHTRKKGQPEIKVHVNWEELIDSEDYIDDLGVDVIQQDSPEYFINDLVGTRVEISKLKRKDWKRGDIRSLYRLVTSLSSPFISQESFLVDFRAVGRESDYSDMLNPDDFLDQAIWKYSFEIKDADFSWSYEFRPPHWKGLDKSTDSSVNEKLQLIPIERGQRRRNEQGSLLLKESDLDGIGPMSGVIYAYYRRSEVLKVSGNQTQLKNWLDDQSGVRVYRDGVRVFNYGEPSDDWLGLNAKRINSPAGKLGTKSLVSAININMEFSDKLKEKTNREGFEQNHEYEMFNRVVNSVFEHFGQLHEADRKNINTVIKGHNPSDKTPRVHEAVSDLKIRLKEHPEFIVIKRDLEAIEYQFEQVRDVMVGAGIAGLNLAVVFHEVERGVDALDNSAKRGDDIKSLRKHIEHIQVLLHTFSPLLKKNPVKNVFASELVEAAIEMRQHRFKFHNIIVSAPLLTKEEADYKIKVPANLIVGALGNLLDNSIYWTQFRREVDDSEGRAAILIKTYWDAKSESGFIAVIDNGPGFTLPEDKAIEPFITRRPDGMGLGLYFASMVMEQCSGILTIDEIDELRDEVEIPKVYDGSAVVLRFGDQK